MRVIAGTRKGLRLQVPPGRAVRPTPDRVREALMSIQGGFFDGERALDLCAGSGAVGIEWLSRGCASAVFVEHSEAALSSLRANLQRARLDSPVGGDAPGDEPCAEVLASSVARALSHLKERGDRFDYIYFDPPYDGDLYGPTLAALADGTLLRGGAELWVESRRGLTHVPAGLALIRSRRFGSTTLDLLQRAHHDD